MHVAACHATLRPRDFTRRDISRPQRVLEPGADRDHTRTTAARSASPSTTNQVSDKEPGFYLEPALSRYLMIATCGSSVANWCGKLWAFGTIGPWFETFPGR